MDTNQNNQIIKSLRLYIASKILYEYTSRVKDEDDRTVQWRVRRCMEYTDELLRQHRNTIDPSTGEYGKIE